MWHKYIKKIIFLILPDGTEIIELFFLNGLFLFISHFSFNKKLLSVMRGLMTFLFLTPPLTLAKFPFHFILSSYLDMHDLGKVIT